MSHNTVTHCRQIPMTHQSGLLPRKGRYYLNIRVPQDLCSLYGKKDAMIRKSLWTSDYREAISRLRYEVFKLDQKFTDSLKPSFPGSRSR